MVGLRADTSAITALGIISCGAIRTRDERHPAGMAVLCDLARLASQG